MVHGQNYPSYVNYSKQYPTISQKKRYYNNEDKKNKDFQLINQAVINSSFNSTSTFNSSTLCCESKAKEPQSNDGISLQFSH